MEELHHKLVHDLITTKYVDAFKHGIILIKVSKINEWRGEGKKRGGGMFRSKVGGIGAQFFFLDIKYNLFVAATRCRPCYAGSK